MDEAVRYKRLVKGVAHKHGMTACFMAKPFDDLAGTGMHMHVSLADAEGHNLFASEAADGTPAAAPGRGRHAQHLARFAADVLPPTPTPIAASRPTATRRWPPPGASTTALSACVCRVVRRRRGTSNTASAAPTPTLIWRRRRSSPVSHRGIRERLDPGAPVEGNGYAQANALLPTDWLTTLRALEDSSWAREAFGQ